MYLEYEGMWLACVPPEAVPAGAPVVLDVMVGPAGRADRVEASYRTGDRAGRVVAVRDGDRGRRPWFRLVLPGFDAGDTVEVRLTAWAGDRQIPPRSAERTQALSIAVTTAPSTEDYIESTEDSVAESHAALVDAGYPTPAAIAATSGAAFVRSVAGILDPARAERVHAAAGAQLAIADSVLTGERLDRVSGLIPTALDGGGEGAAAGDATTATATAAATAAAAAATGVDCGCSDCRAATSPLAYLTDLLGYASARLRIRDGVFDTDLGRRAIALLLQQPFEELPIDCATTEDQICQVRLCVEVLERLVLTHLGAAPDAAVAPLRHTISFAFAADVDDDGRDELVVGFRDDSSSWLSTGDGPRAGIWVLRYDRQQARWRHLRPGAGPTAAAVLLPKGVRATYGFAAKLRPDPSPKHIVLVLEEPDQPVPRLWILQYDPMAASAEQAWPHLSPAGAANTGADFTLPLSTIERVFAADVDGDGLDELLAYGSAPPAAAGQPDRSSAFWAYDFDGTAWSIMGPPTLHDVAFVCHDSQWGVRLATAGDIDLDGRAEVVAVPDAPGNFGKNPWIMKYDPTTTSWSHLLPTGLPLDADADVGPAPWPTAVALVGSVTGIGSAELVIAPQPVAGADPTRFTLHRYDPNQFGGPAVVDAGALDCTQLSLPVERALLADVDGDLRDELVVLTRQNDRRAAWVMDRDPATGGWAHLSPIAGHPLGGDLEWTAGGRYPAASVFAADVDGDGRQELVFVTGGTEIWVLTYDRDAGGWRHLSPVVTDGPRTRWAFAAYLAMLTQLGTSYEELRQARSAAPAQREALAARLGLHLDTTRPDVLDRLLPGTGAPADVTPEAVEELFGVASTTRDPLSAGLVRGAGSDQVVRWRLDGGRWSADPVGATTSPDGIGYASIDRLSPTRVSVTLYRDAARSYPVAYGEGDPSRPIALAEHLDSGLTGTITVTFRQETDGVELVVFPVVAVSRWRRLRQLWDTEDRPADAYSGTAALPVIDPDLIGVDDFRVPLAKAAPGDPDGPFDLWVARRAWLDGLVTALRAAGGDVDDLLATMRPPAGGGAGSYPWSTAPANLAPLVEALSAGTADEVRAATATVVQALHLTVDAFRRLMELRARAAAGEPPTPAGWSEIRSILVSAHKRAAYPAWLAAEAAAGVRLDTATFVATASTVDEGEWPPEPVPADQILGGSPPPMVDPDRVSLADLPTSVAGARSRQVWRWRTAELAANAAAVASAGTWEQRLVAALGPAPAGGDWPTWVEDRGAELADLDPGTVATAAVAVRAAGLSLADFGRVAAVNARVAAGLTPTPLEQRDADRALANARKVRLLYPTWRTAEAGLPYWQARRHRLARWRADGQGREVWLAGLAERSRPPVVDPDTVPRSWLRHTWSQAGARRQQRLALLYQRETALRAGQAAAASDLAAVDGTLLDGLWTLDERRRVTAHVTAGRLAGSPGQVAEQVLGAAPDRIASLLADLDAGGAAATAARRVVLGELAFTTEAGFRLVAGAVATGPATVPAAFDQTLASAGLVGAVAGAARWAEETGTRLAARLAALRLDAVAWRRLLAVRRHAVDGSPILPAERDEVTAIVQRAEKERLFGAWRAEEHAAQIRLGPDSFAVGPDEEGWTPPAWRGRPAEVHRWRSTLRSRAEQHRQVAAALAGAGELVDEATMPGYRDELLAMLPIPGLPIPGLPIPGLPIPGQRGKPDAAAWAADHLLIDTTADGCARTTRVALAIDAVLALLWSARTGRLSATYPQIQLDAPSFDRDWRWVGSYASWRSAMLVHLYPENLVRPSLHSFQSPAQRAVIEELRGTRQLSPARARAVAGSYAQYFSDICRLDLARLVCGPTVFTAYSPVFLVRGDGGMRFGDPYFAVAQPSKRVYWAVSDRSGEVDGTGRELGFWHRLEQLGSGAVVELAGAALYQPTSDPAHPRWLYLFAVKQVQSGHSLVFLRYDLDSAEWDTEATPLDPPPGATELTAWVMPGPNHQPPKLCFEYLVTKDQARQVTRATRSMGAKGTGWERADFVPVAGFGDWQAFGTGPADYASTGITARALLAADVDGDGIDEVVVVPKTTAPVVVLDYDGQSWTQLPRPSVPVPEATLVAAGRFAAGHTRESVAFLGPWSATAARRAHLLSWDPGTSQWSVTGAANGWADVLYSRIFVSGDFDGDGVTEIVAASPKAPLFWVLARDGNGVLAVKESLRNAVPAYQFTSGSWSGLKVAFRIPGAGGFLRPGFVVTGDFDGDGRDEIVVAGSPRQDNVSVGNDLWAVDLRHDGNVWSPLGSFDPADPGRPMVDLSTEKLYLLGGVAGDFDGDGRDELLIIPDEDRPDTGTSVVVLDYRPGPAADPGIRGSWARLTDIDLTWKLTNVGDVVVGDFDGDGIDEVALLSNGSLWLRKYDLQSGGWVEFPGGNADLGVPGGAAFGRSGRFVATGPADQLVLQPGGMTFHRLPEDADPFEYDDIQRTVEGVPSGRTLVGRRFVARQARPPACTPPWPLAPAYADQSGWVLDDTLAGQWRVLRERSERALRDNQGRPVAVQRVLAEAFYDLPVAVALAVHAAGQPDRALEWLRLVYDYTRPRVERKVYFGLVLDEQGTAPDAQADPADYARALLDWVRDPLDPHHIAALRPHTCSRATQLLVVRCHLDYADVEFTRDTPESLPRARILYRAALELLADPVFAQRFDGCDDVVVRIPAGSTEPGLMHTARRLESGLSRVPDRALAVSTARAVAAALDADGDVADRVVRAERLAISAGAAGERARLADVLDGDGDRTGARLERLRAGRLAGALPWLVDRISSQPAQARWYLSAPGPLFCVSPNPMLKALRLHAELNLYKLRTCRNIAGLRRATEPYSAPTDQESGLPVIGAEGTLTLPANRVAAPTPYRYSALIEQAKALAGQARDIEAMMLAALEKRDAEALNLLRARQEVRVTRAGLRLQELRVRQAEDRVTLAELQREKVVFEYDHYQELIDEGQLDLEGQALALLAEVAQYHDFAAGFSVAAGLGNAAAAVAYASGGVAAAALSSAAGALSSAAGAASSLAAGASTRSQLMSMRAGFARMRQDWEFRKALAGHDKAVAGQQVMIENDGVRVAEQERLISELHTDHAEQVLEFQQAKFTNAELYDWLADVLERIYRWFLQQATAVAQLASQQLAFERQEGQPPAILADYWEPSTTGDAQSQAETGRRGLTGAVRLLQDITELDQYAFETNRRKLQLTRTISLAQLAPLELQALRTAGVMTFTTPLSLFDHDFPGHYLRLVRRVSVSVVALVPPGEGVKATLSTTGVSRVVVGPDLFRPVVVARPPESVALTSPVGATGVFTFEPATGMRDPFEGLGVDTTWELRLPRPANPIEPSTVADVLVTIDYTALDSPGYRQQVVRELDRGVDALRGYSLRHEFADAWWDLHNPDQTRTPLAVGFTTLRSDLPPNVEEATISSVALSLVGRSAAPAELAAVTLTYAEAGATARVGGAAAPVDGIVSTRRGNGGPWLPITGKAPAGRWELALPDTDGVRQWLADDQLTDILLVVGYAGRTPPWPD
ncbi:MAG TPA: neuraminidase-like domain-containing protein [Micromonosporaceae bacterium]|nr:neuraminidase-like domain-containing protein [Micromonosporaceae bacterium]